MSGSRSQTATISHPSILWIWAACESAILPHPTMATFSMFLAFFGHSSHRTRVLRLSLRPERNYRRSGFWVLALLHHGEVLFDYADHRRGPLLDVSLGVGGLHSDDEGAPFFQVLRIVVEDCRDLAHGNVIHRLAEQDDVELLRGRIG